MPGASTSGYDLLLPHNEPKCCTSISYEKLMICFSYVNNKALTQNCKNREDIMG